MRESEPESVLIKVERLKDDQQCSESHRGLKNRGERAVDSSSDGVENASAQGTQDKPEKHIEELTEEHSTRHSVWEGRGQKEFTVRKAKKERANLRLQRGESDLRAGRLSDLDSEYALYERQDQMGTCFAQGTTNTESENPSLWYATGMDSERLSVHSELQSVPATEEGAGNSLSSFGSFDWQPEIVMIDSVPIKLEAEVNSVWNSKPTIGVDHTQPRSQKDGDREGINPENIMNACPPYTQMTVRQKMTQSKSSAVDMKSFPSSKNLRTNHGAGMRGTKLFCKPLEEGFGCPKDIQLQQTGERPFSCPQCGKLFAHPGRLKVHQRVHTGEKPFSCMLCGKRFAQSSHIKRHQRVHTGEKPFSCTQCGKSFSHLCNLKTHQTVHTGERPYSCTQCGKNFSSLGNLIRHQSVHIGK